LFLCSWLANEQEQDNLHLDNQTRTAPLSENLHLHLHGDDFVPFLVVAMKAHIETSPCVLHTRPELEAERVIVRWPTRSESNHRHFLMELNPGKCDDYKECTCQTILTPH
jgi:hypothetical protein